MPDELNDAPRSLKLVWSKNRKILPILVLGGLHGGASGYPQSPDALLSRCREILKHARKQDMPLAFARYIPLNTKGGAPYPVWLPGVEPTTKDMVFDISASSFYSNVDFSLAFDYSVGQFAFLGYFQDDHCIATGMDADKKGHRLSLLSDVIVCGGKDRAAVNLQDVAAASGATVMKSNEWFAKFFMGE